MENINIKSYLSEVASQFKARLDKLQRIGSKQLCETDYFLSEVLFKVAAKGAQFPIEKLVNTALALELLNQATNLGRQAQASSFFSDEILLATDYYYAEAIEQVIDLNEPEVVKHLAKAIADTAADRSIYGFEPAAGKHLFTAAVELGLYLGACSTADRKSLRESLVNISHSSKSEMLKIINI